jgi:hypothetical protein
MSRASAEECLLDCAVHPMARIRSCVEPVAYAVAGLTGVCVRSGGGKAHRSHVLTSMRYDGRPHTMTASFHMEDGRRVSWT